MSKQQNVTSIQLTNNALNLSKTTKTIGWVLRIIVAVILLQTLFFKFSAHPDSVYIFDQTGLGAAGRIGSGIAELIIAILLLVPRTVWLGAVGALGTISGAIFFHLTSLGIEVNGDGGTLFALALIVFFGSLGILWIYRKSLPIIGDRL